MNARFSLNNQDNGTHQRRLTVPLAAAACHYSQRELKDDQGFSPQTIYATSIQREISSQTRLEKDNRLRQIALETAQEGKYSKTIEILTQLIDRNSANANDYNNRGLAYFQNGQLDAAIADYNQAIHLNPHLAGAYNNRANYYASQGRLQEAIEDYDKTIDLNPVHIRAWINQGITFRDMGEYEQAIDNFDFALRLGWLKGHIFAERGRTYHLVGDWNCAIADYRRALEHLDLSHSSSASAATRLRQQVENWLNELLSPFQS